MKSHEVIKETVDKLGAKKVAAELGVSLSLLYKWSEPAGESGAANPLDRVAELCKVTDDPRPVSWLCQQMNGVFVKNPPPADAKPTKVDVLQQTQKLVTAFSEMLTAVATGWEDAELTVAEAEKIRAEWDDLKSVAETFVVGCEQHAKRKR
jgi:hypothetical protein